MKKVLALALALAVVLCFAGCKKTGGTDQAESSEPAAVTSSEYDNYETIEGGTGDVVEYIPDATESSSSSTTEDTSSTVSDPVDSSETSTPDSGNTDSDDEPV